MTDVADHDAAVVSDGEGWVAWDRLPDGDYVLDVNAVGFIGQDVLVRAGSAPVVVTLAPALPIAGVVVDEASGAPVEGLVVSARSVLALGWGRPWVAVSDAAGAFHIAALPPGRYTLTVGPQGGMEPSPWIEREVGTFEGGTTDLRIEVTRGLAIAGQIRDGHGLPVTRPVTVEALGLNDFGDRDYARRRHVVSDAEGRFRVAGLPPGRYDLAFELAAPEGAEDGPPVASALRRGVAAGTEGLVVDLDFGDVVTGRVVDEAGAPVATSGAIYIHPVGTVAGAQEGVVVPTGPDGAFRSPGLDPDTTFRILASGFHGYLQGIHEGVRPGSPEVVITLARAGSIRGRVVDAEGQAVPAGVPVSAYAVDAPRGAPGSGWTAYTAPGGAFDLDTLGPYAFLLRAGGGESAYRGAQLEHPVRPGAEVVLRVEVGVELSGRLLDADGLPVRTSYLAGSGEGAGPGLPSSTEVASEDGRFTLRGLPPGRVLLRARLGEDYVDLGVFEAPATDVEVRIPR
jgi:hypothetical protein